MTDQLDFKLSTNIMALGFSNIKFCSQHIVGACIDLGDRVIDLVDELYRLNNNLTRFNIGKYMWQLLNQPLKDQWHRVKLPCYLDSSRTERIASVFSTETIVLLWIESAAYIVHTLSHPVLDTKVRMSATIAAGGATLPESGVHYYSSEDTARTYDQLFDDMML